MAGFKLGDFEFLTPGARAPLNRRDMRPRVPLTGATPPDWLVGCVRDANATGPGAILWNGDFCGHSEPAHSVFDVVIDGQDTLEVAILEPAENQTTILARPAGTKSPWTMLHSTAWFNEGQRPQARVQLPSNAAEPTPGPSGSTTMRLAIGFEYPIECTSQNDVSWVVIAAKQQRDGDEFVLADEELY